MYTISGSSKGNKALSNPVGLITADEVAMAGGIFGATNKSYYLYNNDWYWTMSPYRFDSAGWADVFYVHANGNLNRNGASGNAPAVRPVINLASDVKLSGTGTSSDPYVVI